jgi:succinyl-diaminopimelate desuccinylase
MQRPLLMPQQATPLSKARAAHNDLLSDPVSLAQKLIRCPSITPQQEGTLDLLEDLLKQMGFMCQRLTFQEQGTEAVDNLYARLGTGTPHFCFAGHVDVVPAGDTRMWHVDPFKGCIHNGILYGRGAVDMKGAIAAFLTAVAAYLQEGSVKGSLSFLLTADEEGIALNGTRKVLEWLSARQETIDFCLVGEPSCMEKVGDAIKIGRRGSLNTTLTVYGVQGHVAYPEQALNPIPALLECLRIIDQGPVEPPHPFFAATHVEMTSIDVGNPTVNMIPGQAQARFNIRFNDFQTGESLQKWIQDICKMHGGQHTLEFSLSGEADCLVPEQYTELLSQVINEITGITPMLTTAGGTSDARFIRHYAPVLEFGLVGRTMHQANECVPCEDLHTLSHIYLVLLKRFFSGR